MPNKTIYIKDSDLPTWDRAQQELGESVSSLFVDCLRERLEAEAIRKKAKKARRVDEVQALTVALAEISAHLNLDIELHPFWSYPILEQNSISHGYKLHQKRANPDRIMSLIIDPLDFDPAGNLDPRVREKIELEISQFWDGTRTDQHTVARVGVIDMELPTRLNNLVGKRGLVKIAYGGEVDFTFLAVHPPARLPSETSNEAMQRAITQSDFTVRFDDGVLIDGSDTKVISGQYISLIRGRY